MSNINFVIQKSDVTTQMIDGLHAYLSSKDINLQITTQNSLNKEADLNIFFTSMPEKDINTEKYDIVLYGNRGEPLEGVTNVIKNSLVDSDTYLIANVFLKNDHPLYDKVLCWPDDIMKTRHYWTSPFYSYYFSNNNINRDVKRDNKIAYINGLNRSIRHNFFKELININGIVPFGNYSNHLINTRICLFESKDDYSFRQELEKLYPEIYDVFNISNGYYEDSVLQGINGKFGNIPPGYEILPEYYQYSCIVFPESSWINNELAITEKVTKCFYSKCLPFPIAGANVNSLYNELGFYTAYNLLPKEYQQFDREMDHFKRHKMTLDSIKYLNNNLNLFESDEFKKYTNHNQINFFTNNLEVLGIEKLYNIIKNKLNSK